MILMTMILNLLPDKKYEKYMRMFTGMVFILLVFGPFADLTGLEERMAGAFERITFQNDARLLQREIEDAEGERLSRLVEGYRDAVETDLAVMADSQTVECLSVEAVLDTDSEGGGLGTLLEVKMKVGLVGEGMNRESGTSGRRERRIQANREIGNLKKRIGEYYGLEEGKITIYLEDE